MLTNEIKKGMRIKLDCGWMAKMADNAKGTIRIAEVYGIYQLCLVVHRLFSLILPHSHVRETVGNPVDIFFQEYTIRKCDPTKNLSIEMVCNKSDSG